MSLDLADYERKAREAVMAFWGNRDRAQQKQREAGKSDQGTRGSVTAGNNMDGFIALVFQLVKANGLPHAAIHRKCAVLTLPGYFRPTKLWDLLVIQDQRLIAAVELKSQVGSFGKNFNNRTEEAIGTAHDFWTAYREGAFGPPVPSSAGLCWLKTLLHRARQSATPHHIFRFFLNPKEPRTSNVMICSVSVLYKNSFTQQLPSWLRQRTPFRPATIATCRT